jgi:hypothetical protein
MARKTTGTTSRTTRRTLNPAELPYAEETRLVDKVIDFLFNRLPSFVSRELHNIDVAVTEANLFRELSDLPDAALKKAGLKRSDLPALVASMVRLMNFSKGRKGQLVRPDAKGRRPQGTKRKTAKRSTALRAKRA